MKGDNHTSPWKRGVRWQNDVGQNDEDGGAEVLIVPPIILPDMVLPFRFLNQRVAVDAGLSFTTAATRDWSMFTMLASFTQMIHGVAEFARTQFVVATAAEFLRTQLHAEICGPAAGVQGTPATTKGSR